VTSATRHRIIAVAGGAGVLVLGLLAAVPLFLRVFRIPQAGMQPAIPAGSRVIVLRTGNVRANDITVFRYPLDDRYVYVQRVVATGGDEVEIRNKQLFVNRFLMKEPYAIHEDPNVERAQPRDQFGPYQVPAGSFFVLGDNRDASSDSRNWGPVPHANVVGRVIFVYRAAR
jgi:signal peptidase I